MEIKGVAAIVTGAGSGLGEATARALAGAGDDRRNSVDFHGSLLT